MESYSDEYPFFIDTSETARIARVWMPGNPITTQSAAPATGSNLMIDTLKNATYQGIYDEPVLLTNGKFEGEPFVEGGASRPTVTFIEEFNAFGDLNGDGINDAAVLLAENSGGSGTFIYLAAVVDQNGTPVNVATQFLEDRAQPKSVAIESNQIIITMATHAQDDPMCCPSQEITKTYRLQGDTLVEVES